MKTTTMMQLTATAMIALSPQLAHADSNDLVERGFEMFNEVCMACHNDTDGEADRQAPPMAMVRNHYSRLGSREAFVAAVSAFVMAPGADKVSMRGAARKFGVMPDLGVSAEDARAVAEFLYVTDFTMPDWMAEHLEAEHGDGGSGAGQGGN